MLRQASWAHETRAAQLCRMEDTWHLLWVDEGAEEMVQTQAEFAKAHLDNT